MKPHLQELVAQALLDLKRQDILPKDVSTEVMIERARSPEHGDYATNIAMVLANKARMAPRKLAESIVERLLASKHVESVDIAGPGFINFRLTPSSLQSVVSHVLKHAENFGRSSEGQGQRITVEFVSANPTGPLHVGHGRGAAYGASLSAILDASGFDVYREYYVNDHGRQMDILAASVWLRYMELAGSPLTFPANGYKGDYIYDIARTVRKSQGDDLKLATGDVTELLPEDGEAGSLDAEEKNKREKYIDALIAVLKDKLGDGFRICFAAALDSIVEDIREDLGEFRVHYENWFSEQSLADSGQVEKALERLRDAGFLYEKDGAQWFKASEFGDEKDRVVIRENGQKTYFASDIAYVLSKLERFDRAIYVLGADHHGYIARLKAAAQGLGEDPDRLEIMLVQFAHLYRGDSKLQMSTRSGEFVTLRELREEVGNDAARYFYIMRSHDQHLDFDLELAKSQSADNPVYYIQYAHARIARLFERAEEKGLSFNAAIGESSLDRLTLDAEFNLMREMAQFPDTVATAARNRGPHMVAHYLRDLARLFQSYYDQRENPILVADDEELRCARLLLASSVQRVLANGLALLGINAPESM